MQAGTIYLLTVRHVILEYCSMPLVVSIMGCCVLKSRPEGGMLTDLFPDPQTQVGLISPERVI